MSRILSSNSRGVDSVVVPDASPVVDPIVDPDVAHAVDDVCSVSNGATNCLGVNDFELISDSDISVGGCVEKG